MNVNISLPEDIFPASIPTFALTLCDKNGHEKDITPNIKPRLMSLTVINNRGLAADQMTLVLDDSDRKIQMPTRGEKVKVFVGRQTSDRKSLGEFTIDQVKHAGAPDTVTVIGRSIDLSNQLNKKQETSWHDITLGNLVDTIASHNELQAELAPSIAQIHIDHIDQSQETDISFLQRLGVLYGLQVIAKNNKLMLIRPGDGVNVDGKPFKPMVITRSQGDQHSFELSDRMSYTGVSAFWLDTKDPKKQTPKVNIACKDTSNSASPVYTAGKSDNVYVMNRIFATKEMATKAAENLWKAIQAQAANFTITLANGRADLSPETPVRVFGFKEVIDQTPWIINNITHTMNNSGFISQLNLEIKIEAILYNANTD